MPHCLQQQYQGRYIVLVVKQRLLYRLAHSLACRKVYNSRYVLLLTEKSTQAGAIAYVEIIKHRALARDLFNTIQHVFAGVRKIVDNNHVKTFLDQLNSCMRAYIPRTSRNQNFFHAESYFFMAR